MGEAQSSSYLLLPNKVANKADNKINPIIINIGSIGCWVSGCGGFGEKSTGTSSTITGIGSSIAFTCTSETILGFGLSIIVQAVKLNANKIQIYLRIF